MNPLDMPIEDFYKQLPMRPRNCIRANLIDCGEEPPYKLAHLMMLSRKEIRRWPNLGKKSLNEIEELLRNYGLQLWEEHDERSLAPLREALQAKKGLSECYLPKVQAKPVEFTQFGNPESVRNAKPVEPDQAKDSARYQWLKANVRCGNMGLPNNNWLDDNTADWDCWIDVCIADESNPEGNPV